MAKRYLGIYLRTDAYKAAELVRDRSSLSIASAASGSFAPDQAFSSLPGIISDAFKQNGFKGREAVVAVSGDKVIYKVVDLPEMPQSDVLSALGFKLGLDLERDKDALVSYYEIPAAGSPDKKYYFTVSASKQYIGKAVRALNKAGISVKEVIPLSCALRTAFPETAGKTCMLMDGDKTLSTILLIKDGIPVFAREISYGSDNIELALTGVVVAGGNRIEITRERAAEILREHGIPDNFDVYSREAGLPAQEILSMARPALEKIGAEILRTLEYYKSQTRDDTNFGALFLTGGVSSVPGFVSYLSKELSIEVSAAKHLSRLKDGKAAFSPESFSVAAGAAGARQNKISLMPEEFKHPWAFKFKKYLLNYYFLSAAYIGLLLIIFYGLSVYASGLQREYQSVIKQSEALGIKAGDDSAEKHFLGFVSKYGDSRQSDRFLKIMEFLDANTPPSIYFDAISYRALRDDLSLKGIILKKGGEGAAPEFVSRLKKSGYFSSVELSSLGDSERFTVDTYEFSISCKLVKGVN